MQLEVTAARAAAFLGEALLLARPSPRAGEDGAAAVLSAVRGLCLVQMDPVRIVGRNHDLALYNRIDGYRPAHFEQALARRLVFEYVCGNRSILPAEDYPWFVPTMARRREHHRRELEALAPAVNAVIASLEKSGPLTSRMIESEEKVSGYWDAAQALRTKATSQALQLLWECGRVLAAGRQNGEIVFDLPERALPAALLEEGRRMSAAEAAAFLRSKYYQAYRLFDAGHALFGFQRLEAAERRAAVEEDCRRGLIVPVRIAGVRRQYYCLSADADRLDPAASAGRSGCGDGSIAEARILPPLDNLLWRRERLADLYGLSYTWEIYTPPHKRKFGPYTMPVLYGTAIPALVDLKHDRQRSALVVLALHRRPGEEERSGGLFIEALARELERLRTFLGADAVEGLP